MIELTAIEKVRMQLTGDPQKDPTFAHEGPAISRWVTGGNQPDLHVFFESQPESDLIFVRCATCRLLLGSMPKDDQAYGLDHMRQSGHEHH